MSPEKAHHFAVSLLKICLGIPLIGYLIKSAFQIKHPKLGIKLFGIDFPNRIGLAAGFDKDGKYIDAMSALGFGFIEVGTVTPRPQLGNPKPRLFRLPKDEALINRMGFNNMGVDQLVIRLKNRPSNVIVGGNIGKNKDTSNEDAIYDYLECFDKLFDHVDYFVVNVSSPNTPGLRELQEKEPLTHLLTLIQKRNKSHLDPKPLLLKIAPDLTDSQLDDIVDIAFEVELDGLIATNTTISREGLLTDSETINSIGAGGLSGKQLSQRSTQVIQYLHQKTAGKIPIIGVGGVQKPEDALEKLKAGASLIQIYTGFVYEGPSIVKNINKTLIGSEF